DVTEQGVDVPRVRHVVAVVDAGGAHDRGEPHPVDAQPLEVPGTVDHALQIAGAVAVGIGERPGVDLVEDHVLPPPARRAGGPHTASGVLTNIAAARVR